MILTKLFLFRAVVLLVTNWRIICVIVITLKLTLLGSYACAVSKTENKNICLHVFLA